MLFATGAACGDNDARIPSLQLAAAADLQSALRLAQPAIEQRCSVDLVLVFGSSGQLKEQVLAGAPFALYLSADASYPREIEAAGLTVDDGVAEYAVGRLALARADNVDPLETLEGLLREDVTHISIANPGHAPYGRAAREAAQSAGVWEAIQSRLVFAENVRQATDYVEQGNAEAGLVALSLVIGTETPYVLVDASLHDPITQTGAIIAGTGLDNESRCILDYLRGADGQALLLDFGFEPVP